MASERLFSKATRTVTYDRAMTTDSHVDDLLVNNSYYHSNVDYSYFYKPEAQEDLNVSNQNDNENIASENSNSNT